MWDTNRCQNPLTPEEVEDDRTYSYVMRHPYHKYPNQRNDVWLRAVGATLTNTPYITFFDDDTWPEENHLEKVDILKIDTEGYEYKILKGLSEKNFTKVKFIYFEHHYDLMLNKNYTFFQIKSLLEKNNFEKVYKIKMSFRKTFEYIYENKSV